LDPAQFFGSSGWKGQQVSLLIGGRRTVTAPILALLVAPSSS
jgi:hypothetical protein